jgi:hypothetical protein
VANPILNPPTSQRDIPTWQRALWALFPVATLGLAAWAPFVYWANRRNYGSRQQSWWIAFAVAAVVEAILASVIGNDQTAASSIVGAYILGLILASSIMAWIKLGPKHI